MRPADCWQRPPAERPDQAGRRAFSRPADVTQRDVVSRRNPRSSSRQSRAIAASLAGNAHQLPGDAHQLCSVGGNRGAFSANRSPITHAKNTSNLGAPLRNRTVDLLLTICNFSGSSSAPNPGKAPCSRQQTSDRGRYMAPPGPGRRLPRTWRPGAICDARCRRATFRTTVERRSDDLDTCPSQAGHPGLSSHLSLHCRELNRRPYMDCPVVVITAAPDGGLRRHFPCDWTASVTDCC